MKSCQFEWAGVRITVEYSGVVNYALQQNALATVALVSLELVGDESGASRALEDIRVELSATGGAGEAWGVSLARLSPGDIWNGRQIRLSFPADELAKLDERRRGELSLHLVGAGVESATFTLEIDWLAYNQWPGVGVTPQILAAFVLPNHPEMVRAVTRMRDILERWTGDGALSGYQSGSTDRVRKVAASVFGTLQELGFSYVNPPASFERAGQKVRTPEQMFNSRMGTCLDVALLAAGALEHAGLHPLVVIIRGHAFVGVWLNGNTFGEAIVDDSAALRKRATLGQLLFFDPTLALEAGSPDFEGAQTQAMNYLADFSNFVLAVDIQAARLGGIRPMSSRVFAADGRVHLLDHSAREGKLRAANPQAMPDMRDLEGRARAHLARVAEFDADQAGRLERWRSKLLDLSLRNRLLNFRHTLSTAMILHHHVGELEDALATGKSFELLAKPEMIGALDPMDEGAADIFKDEKQLRPLVEDNLKKGRIHSAYPAGEHTQRLKQIYRDSRRELQESGVNLLHVAVGFLRWFDPKSPRDPRLAPLILLPARLDRLSATNRYRLALTDDEAVVNHSLLEKLRQEFSLEIPGISILPEDASGLDIDLIFRQFRQAILDIKGWDILETAALGSFSFGKFMMWHDLRANEARLLDNPVVARILEPTGVSASTSETDARDDAEEQAIAGDGRHTRSSAEELEEAAFCVMDADFSQLEAVRAAANGESFVLQGPPGTGKSQTITNIIAQCVSMGKSVLFVAEKKAALDVVYRRLAQVGLDDFCLRLHSDNANKRAVASQLGTALQQAAARTPSQWTELVARKAESRAPIDAYVELIHQKRAIGHTLFEVVARLSELRAAHMPVVKVNLSVAAEAYSASALSAALEASAAVADFGPEVAPIGAHPLRELQKPIITAEKQREFELVLGRMSAALDAFDAARQSLPETVPAAQNIMPGTLGEHAAILAHLVARPPGGRLLAQTADWQLLAPRLQQSVSLGRQIQASEAELYDRYTEAFFELDLAELRRKFGRWGQAFFLVAFFMLWGARRAVRRVTRDGQLPGTDEVVGHLDQALALSAQKKTLEEQTWPPALTGTLWQGAGTDWQVLDEASAWMGEWSEYLARQASPGDWRELSVAPNLPGQDAGASIQAYERAVQELVEVRDTLVALTGLDEQAWAGRGDWSQTMRELVERWKGARGQLRAWSLYLNARGQMEDCGLLPLISAFEADELAPDELVGATESALLGWWVGEVFASEAQLAAFSQLSHERAIEKFRQLDADALAGARREVHARLASRIPQPQATSTSSEVGVLLREIQKKSRHLPIRELFGRIPNLLPRIAPCILMSPMSVAQYLSADPVKFDLVIFDEASQIAPWDALGAISRAQRCIVVGDSKQLPPTSFFAKSFDDDELQDVDDLESILDECLAAGLNTRRLRWHYRSRDESLIAFSNFHYYDNNLWTFPSALGDSNAVGVSYRHVPDGFYDKGGTRTNRAEAEAIVAEIVGRLADAAESRRSIGVVTFSQAQQTLIEDLLDEARRAHPAIEPYFSDAVAEPVFVKNLENVQGDERDIMMFSICYAPDAQGKLSMNFGPLNRQGGERRLNVAITRAREQLLVFATLRAEQIDLNRTAAQAVSHLKTFLKYAEIGPRAIAEAASRESASPVARATASIQQELRVFLEASGYQVEQNIGYSGYLVDLAVRHPDSPESFMLGIELDGEGYRLGQNARDRERTRPSVLKSLGWHIFRVWTAAWWHERERVMARLLARLEELRPEPAPTLVTSTNEAQAEAFEAVDEDVGFQEIDASQRAWADALLDGGAVDFMGLANAEPYRLAEIREDAHTQTEFNDDANLAAIAHDMQLIVEAEAPVYAANMLRRVARAWGYARLSQRIEGRILQALQKLPVEQRPRREGEFFWAATTPPDAYRAFRPAQRDGHAREAQEIAAQEVANAARAILAFSMSLPVEDLYRETVRVFGFAQLGNNLRELAAEGVELLIASGDAKLDGGVVSVVSAANLREKAENASNAAQITPVKA